MITDNEVIDRFHAAMAEAGMVVKEALIADGGLHRVYVEGDKPGTTNGAYKLHLDGYPAGFFQHHSRDIKTNWTVEGRHKPLSLAKRRQNELNQKQLQDERKKRQIEAAKKARFIWSSANLISDQSQHPYLVKKCIKPYLARLYKGALVIPLFNESRELVNLQFIDAEGNKRFLAGGKKKGCFSVIGDSSKETKLLICEGYATGASLYDGLSLFVMVAMDAGNLEPVAQAARRMFPDYEIIIAGDNDISGKGQSEARKAALAINGKYLIPQAPGKDWNDIIAVGAA